MFTKLDRVCVMTSWFFSGAKYTVCDIIKTIKAEIHIINKVVKDKMKLQFCQALNHEDKI